MEFNITKYTRNNPLLKESEEDLGDGGWIEAMHPDLFKHVDEIVRIFGEWKSGPMTEPGMEEPAKEELIGYITDKLRGA